MEQSDNYSEPQKHIVEMSKSALVFVKGEGQNHHDSSFEEDNKRKSNMLQFEVVDNSSYNHQVDEPSKSENVSPKKTLLESPTKAPQAEEKKVTTDDKNYEDFGLERPRN